MGWTGTHVNGLLRTSKAKKEAMDGIFSENPKWGTVVKSSIRGSEYYAAIRLTKTGKVFGLVCLVRVDNNDYFNITYKDMDESCGPFYYNCPKSIIALLSPTDNKNALKWREKCLEKKRKIQDGDCIKFAHPVEFQSGEIHDTFRIVKRGRRFVFTVDGNHGFYSISNWRKRKFEVVGAE